MIAFFFTIPISRMIPINAITLRSVRHNKQRQNRAHARRRQRRQNRDRVDVALIEHAQHDVDRHQRRQNQQWFARQRRLEGLRRALEAGLNAGRQSDLAAGRFDRLYRLTQGHAGRQVEGERDGGKLTLVIDGQRRCRRFEMGKRTQRHLRTG